MAKIKALELSRDVDLSAFAQYLRQGRIPHRISEEGEHQVVWVESESAGLAVTQAYDLFKQGGLPTVIAAQRSKIHFLSVLLRSPLTLTVILANLICFPVTLGIEDGEIGVWLRLFTLLDLNEIGDQWYFANLQYTIESNQWWRLVTPMFLHFGWIHIVFNLLWVWEIGRRIEIEMGVLVLFGLILLSSIAANLTQYFMFGAGLFGGMSGVVYGLLGCAMIWSRWVPARSLGLPGGIYIFMLLFLVLGFTGAVDLLGLGSLANGAHLGGLVAGILCGFLLVGGHRVLKKRRG